MPARRTLPDRTCEQCGSEFRQKGGTSGRFCSKACWYAWPGRVPARTCEACKAEFRPSFPTQRACSVSCGNALKRSPRRSTSCVRCGGPLKANAAIKVRYCSHGCAAADRWASGSYDRQALPVGERRPASSGYIRVKTVNGWELEHRVVVAERLGRPLEPHERVHHRNGRRDDNRDENLELWRVKAKDPAGVRAEDYHCPGCRCGD